MMASRRLNVLVYTGTGTTSDSVRHCISSLRQLLTPNYAVIPISETTLLTEPWAPTCALLVMPGGADLGYCRVLNGDGNSLIKQYVRRGGAYLGFCAGGYYGSRRCEFEVGNPALEVIGSRELAFFPGTCRGGAFKGFEYGSERGARAAKIAVRKQAFAAIPTLSEAMTAEFRCYVNGGGVFVPADPVMPSNVEVLAQYSDGTDVDGGEEKAAVVLCKIGEGAALLTGPHPEFAAANLNKQPDVPGYDDLLEDLAADEEARMSFLSGCLEKLGLEIITQRRAVPALTPLHLSGLTQFDVDELLRGLQDATTKENCNGEGWEGSIIMGEQDVFQLDAALLPNQVPPGPFQSNESGKANGETGKIKNQILVHRDHLPRPDETPQFDHELFFSGLKQYREKEMAAEQWGDVLLYGEVVASTNTLLEKNPKLLARLPTGFTLAATTQLAGRGRGSNVWVSPAGSLLMSTVINHPSHLAVSRPIVFIQYLAAIAIAEAIQTYDRGYGEVPVKLKWPNDIYARDPSKPVQPPSYVKIGGILSNCSYDAASGAYQVVLGIGLNTTNGRPTTSLDALLPPLNAKRAASAHLAPFRIERLLARILTRLEALYGAFLADGFAGAGLESRYYAHWLHSGQVVTLEAEGGVRARVLGITRDWGMLRAEELRADEGDGDRGGGAGRPTGKVWALQSDENSFDFWRGLVRRKV